MDPPPEYDSSLHLDIGDVTYIGVDIVTEMIDINRTLYGTSRSAFFKLNVVQQVVPEVDLILCRQSLNHLPLADIHATISNFNASRSTYLLATHFPNIERNVDVVTGRCRGLDLTLRPFHFPEPIAILSEDQSDQCLALWRLADIKSPVAWKRVGDRGKRLELCRGTGNERVDG